MFSEFGGHQMVGGEGFWERSRVPLSHLVPQNILGARREVAAETTSANPSGLCTPGGHQRPSPCSDHHQAQRW
jgi:hypothetical protein